MLISLPRFASLALLAAFVSPWSSVHAEPLGSAASSASSAGSASLGSLSDSIQGSSRSSSGKNQVAEGDYRVIEVATAPDKAEHRLIRLQATTTPAAADASAELTVQVPAAALGAKGLQSGDTVRIRHRFYGLEFARAAQAGAAPEPFFLALDDAWHRQLASRPVSL
jgi:hypothetical protein